MYMYLRHYIVWFILGLLAHYEYLMSLHRFFGVPDRSWELHDYAFGLLLANIAAFLLAPVSLLVVYGVKRLRSRQAEKHDTDIAEN